MVTPIFPSTPRRRNGGGRRGWKREREGRDKRGVRRGGGERLGDEGELGCVSM